MKYYKTINDKNMIFPDRTKGVAFIKGKLYTEKELMEYCELNKWNFDKIVKSNFLVVEN